MLRRAWILGMSVSIVSCMGTGIDRRDGVPARALLSIRPVADGDPFVESVAIAAQDPPFEVEVEVSRETIYSPRLPPIDSVRVWAGSKGTLERAVGLAGSVPSGLQVAYEDMSTPQRARWSLMVVRRDEGLVLGSETLVKPAWGPSEPKTLDGVYLLLGAEDGRAFEQLTIAHDGRRLAILDGDEVLMAPTVQEPIGGGQLLISPGADGSASRLYERLTGKPLPEAPGPQQ